MEDGPIMSYETAAVRRAGVEWWKSHMHVGTPSQRQPWEVQENEAYGRAILAAALDVEEMARIISSHRHGSQVAWDEDRRTAEALRAAILGGAA